MVELKDGVVSNFEIEPEDAGVGRHPIEEIKGGSAAHNAKALSGVLAGDNNAYRDIVLMNAGAGLLVAGLAENLKDGAEKAAQSIDSGAAKQALEKLIAVSNGKS